MASLADLKTWFERDIKFAKWDENIHLEELDAGKTLIRFFTDTNEYQLTLTPDGEEAPRFDCAVKARKSRAGLAAPRVRQLWRGRPHRLNERMWRRLLGAVVGLELVRVHRRGVADQAEPDSVADGLGDTEIGAAAE